ncbi:hypothetical protein V8O11_24710 [Erwinia aphidicola]|uniref:Zinc ribbon protein n=1 Tax=Erwinia aphidicola TaxID=68334 RepID=A0ABU8DML4_ERWAP
MSEQNLITCSHCRSDIPRGANVCKGCRAEIKYGTPGLFMVRNLNRFFSDHLTMEGDTTHTCYGADQHEFCDKNAIFAGFLT